MIISALELDIAWEDPQENFDRVAALMELPRHAGSRLVVLPEMFATGFSMDGAKVAARGDEVAGFLSELARRHGLFVLGGFAEPGEDRPHNAAALFDPGGHELFRYRKIHPFSLGGEDRSFAAGDRIVSADVEGVRVTPFICYDLRFPEPFRAAAERTDLFCVIANWPSERRFAWRQLLVARAIENQCWVLGVNRVGEGGGLVYVGDSALIDPQGHDRTVVSGRAQVLMGDVRVDEVVDARRRFGFLADRRPEVYDGLDS